MSNSTKTTTSSSLPKMEAVATASNGSEKTPRSESLSSKATYGVFFGVADGRPFATLHKNRAGYEPRPVYAHSPNGWTIADFFSDLDAALAKLNEARQIIAKYATI